MVETYKGLKLKTSIYILRLCNNRGDNFLALILHIIGKIHSKDQLLLVVKFGGQHSRKFSNPHSVSILMLLLNMPTKEIFDYSVVLSWYQKL